MLPPPSWYCCWYKSCDEEVGTHFFVDVLALPAGVGPADTISGSTISTFTATICTTIAATALVIDAGAGATVAAAKDA